ncbi:MAG: flagellar protein FlaG, partial [Deltaproteobacteria bacterium]|nr:flagellar protein FlaG [Deltaproteobacteria bacterium]
MEVKEIKEESLPSFVREPLRDPPLKSRLAFREAVKKGTLNGISSRDEESVRELADRINEFMRSMNYSLQFVPDREAGIVVIRVLDGKGKVIRQIPPEAMG